MFTEHLTQDIVYCKLYMHTKVHTVHNTLPRAHSKVHTVNCEVYIVTVTAHICLAALLSILLL